MQRILNIQLATIFITLLVSAGCCKNSPWSIVKSSDWGPGDFRFVSEPEAPLATQLVRRGETPTGLNELDSVDESETVTTQPSQESSQQLTEKTDPSDTNLVATNNNPAERPGILDDVEMIDPAELTRQIQEEQEKNGNQPSQIASEWTAPPVSQPIAAELNQFEPAVRQVTYEETVMAQPQTRQVLVPETNTNANENSSLSSNTVSVPNGMLKPLSPAAELVSHPLRPILYKEAPQVEAAEPVDEMDYELKNLPPLVLAATSEPEPAQLIPDEAMQPLEQSIVQSKTDSFNSIQWETAPKNEPEIIPEYKAPSNDQNKAQQVAWFQEIDDALTQQKLPSSEEPPKSDEFTTNDFAQTNCEKSCSSNCPSDHVHSIASEIVEDGSEIATIQFQEEWQYKNMGLPAPRFIAKQTQVEQNPLQLPEQAELSTLPTDLPIPPTQPNDDNSFQLPGETDTQVIPATANVTENKLRANVIAAGFARAVEPVKPVPVFKPPKPLTWREQLQETVSTLQSQIRISNDPNERSQLEGKLELLRLLPDELDPTQQQYLDALTDLLQATGQEHPQDVYSAGQTLEKLRSAVSYMESVASMKIVNATFCSKVVGFGQFTPTETMTFVAGQQVLVYCEIENHSAQPRIQDGQTLFSTRLSGSFVVYDNQQNAVQQDSFPVVEDLARQRRQDFYMHIPLTFGELPPGEYTYQLMVDDVGGNKSASLPAPIRFTIR